jgi:hypothetical protein
MSAFAYRELEKLELEKLALFFLREHCNANDIVMDTRTGLPVKAVYTGPTCFGRLRTQPAVFYFEDYLADD